MSATSVPLRRAGRIGSPGRPPAWLVLLAFGAALLILVATTAEVGLRIAALRISAAADPRCAGSDASQLTQKGLYVPDPAAGYAMRANVCVRLRTSEYDEVLRTNSRGLVGPEVPAAKAPGEFRIVVVGDSYTVGGQVPYEQTFPAALEQELRRRGAANVRVINVGVGGYTTFNEAGLLREHVAWLQPDVVIVAVFVGNDVAENVLATAAGYRVDPDHPKGLTFGPAASDLVQQSIGWFPRNGPLATNTGQSAAADPVVRFKTFAHQVWDGSRTNSLLLGALFGAPPDPSVSTAPGARPPSKDQRLLNVSSFEWTILRDIPHTDWLDRAWPLMGQYLADIRSTADARGAHTLVLIIPQIAQVEPAERARTMADYRFADDEVDWTRPQREVLAQAQRAGLPVLDELPPFQAATTTADEALYLSLDEHFTAAGHRLTAHLLADAITANAWLR